MRPAVAIVAGVVLLSYFSGVRLTTTEAQRAGEARYQRVVDENAHLNQKVTELQTELDDLSAELDTLVNGSGTPIDLGGQGSFGRVFTTPGVTTRIETPRSGGSRPITIRRGGGTKTTTAPSSGGRGGGDGSEPTTPPATLPDVVPDVPDTGVKEVDGTVDDLTDRLKHLGN